MTFPAWLGIANLIVAAAQAFDGNWPAVGGWFTASCWAFSCHIQMRLAILKMDCADE